SVILAGAGPAWTGQPAVEPQAHQAAKAAGPAPKLVENGPKGLDPRSRDGNYHAHIELRAQLRMTHRDFDDPIAPSPEESDSQFTINRARFKLRGHAYRPWLEYYLEYDFVNSWLLELRFTLRASDGLRLRVGQWMVPYNRGRVDSSGKQQFVERSIVTPRFTLDRQQGGRCSAACGRGRTPTSGTTWGFSPLPGFPVAGRDSYEVQAGYFVHVLFPAFPKPLEIALRWAEVDPDTAVAGDLEQETTMVANWFFSGHRNKLTFDFSRLRNMANQSGRRWANRIRLKWDVSF
ncbi:MAG: porin, partial [Acidobacteriota bacterium]